jgi:hypothetical protein
MARYHTRIVSLGTAVTFEPHLCTEPEMDGGREPEREDGARNGGRIQKRPHAMTLFTGLQSLAKSASVLNTPRICNKATMLRLFFLR